MNITSDFPALFFFDRVKCPCTEGQPDYEFGNWMKHLAIMEQFVASPLLIVPFISAFRAFFLGLSEDKTVFPDFTLEKNK